ncbi:MAG: FtsQ-type POTRA domain-containing protein [Actinomycetaceae bacterium]|nr:FtsQ-type POTRA domain-containing protein [Arcanobacterium sp.]MDD7505425.1 FtsQ-type POTRA domain-containing protein [Actinomycetaceae bacterium]MDY6142766.1 FtsQ-type POTRA domain-containing protein [Arcanobacterium sp.]
MSGSVASLNAMRSEQRRRRRRTRLIRAVIASVSLALVATLAWVVLFSPLFRYDATEFSVSGLSKDAAIGEQQVKDALEPFDGKQMFTTRSSAIARAVESIPEVESASVDRVLFHGLEVSITEKEPIAAYSADGRTGALAGDGTFIKVSQARKGTLPVIRISQEAPGHARVMRAVATILSSIPDDVRERINIIDVGAGLQVTFTTGDHRSIIWGVNEDNANKSKLLAVLWGTESSMIDVSLPEAPVTQ